MKKKLIIRFIQYAVIAGFCTSSINLYASSGPQEEVSIELIADLQTLRDSLVDLQRSLAQREKTNGSGYEILRKDIDALVAKIRASLRPADLFTTVLEYLGSQPPRYRREVPNDQEYAQEQDVLSDLFELRKKVHSWEMHNFLVKQIQEAYASEFEGEPLPIPSAPPLPYREEEELVPPVSSEPQEEQVASPLPEHEQEQVPGVPPREEISETTPPPFPYREEILEPLSREEKAEQEAKEKAEERTALTNAMLERRRAFAGKKKKKKTQKEEAIVPQQQEQEPEKQTEPGTFAPPPPPPPPPLSIPAEPKPIEKPRPPKKIIQPQPAQVEPIKGLESLFLGKEAQRIIEQSRSLQEMEPEESGDESGDDEWND